MGHLMRLKRTTEGLRVQLANHYTTRGANVVIYEALCFDVAQGQYEWGTQWDSNSLG